MKKFYVYVHVCPNGKRYVGCTTQAKPERRWGKNGKGYYQNEHFYRAILKYGWDNITHEVFEVDSKEEMYRKEIELISFYHTNDPRYGYNHSVGGEKSTLGCTRSEEFRKHMSEVAKKEWLDPEIRRKKCEAAKKVHADPEYRKKLSEAIKKSRVDPEVRRKMSLAKKGKPHSEETRKRIAEAMKGKPHSVEHKRHIAEAMKGKPKPKVKIKLQDGTTIEITKNNLARDYINKGKEFEYVS